jgi:8-oxo-dGTP pyrophosphatase MutT (NUDIX family)
MSNPHRRRRRPANATAVTPQNGKPAQKVQGKPHKSGIKAKRPPRTRWFYDVRQYAILTDGAAHILILQLPKDYDATAANTWTLPGGKLEPNDEPGEGLLREIREETGLPATLVGPCAVARWTSRNSKKLGIFYHATVEGDKPEFVLSGEHQRAIWVGAGDLNDFPFHRPEMLEAVQKNIIKAKA